MKENSLYTRKRQSPLKVLFVGQVSPRKGIPYLFEAIRRFSPNDVCCRVVGPLKIFQSAIKKYCPENVKIVGPVSRQDLGQHYEWADVFCLPSLCEGSATVLYEAASFGLPIITTPNSGSPFGEDQGCHLVPVRDGEAIVHILKEFVKGNIKPLDVAG
jgi:glycosyltransferase involved in cell wall biosynthesis